MYNMYILEHRAFRSSEDMPILFLLNYVWTYIVLTRRSEGRTFPPPQSPFV